MLFYHGFTSISHSTRLYPLVGTKPNFIWFNGHVRDLNWRYRFHIEGLNFREYPSKIWPEIWY